MMKVDLDTLLKDDLLSVPDDFAQRVMHEVHLQPMPKPPSRQQERLQWLALLAAAGLGLSQILAFIFGLWATSLAL